MRLDGETRVVGCKGRALEHACGSATFVQRKSTAHPVECMCVCRVNILTKLKRVIHPSLVGKPLVWYIYVQQANFEIEKNVPHSIYIFFPKSMSQNP